MSERKVINKYYPPDYDPSKIIKKKKKVKTGSASLPTVRLMTPFSMKCLTCGEYIAKSKKFNARKENTSESYLGMKIVRFHIKCPRCASEILFRTDPKSADYVIEFGAQKNYDSGNTNKIMKEESQEETLERLEKEEEEAKRKLLEKDKKQTSLEELEAKLNDIRNQQEISDQIDDLRERNSKLNEFTSNSEMQREIKEKLKKAELERLVKESEEDEKLAEEAFKNQQASSVLQSTNRSFPGDTNDMLDKNTGTNKTTDAEASSKTAAHINSDSDSDSDSDDYHQPLFSNKPKAPQKVVVKRKSNALGVSIKKLKK